MSDMSRFNFWRRLIMKFPISQENLELLEEIIRLQKELNKLYDLIYDFANGVSLNDPLVKNFLKKVKENV